MYVYLWIQLMQHTQVHSSDNCHKELLSQSTIHTSKLGNAFQIPDRLQQIQIQPVLPRLHLKKYLWHGCQRYLNSSVDTWIWGWTVVVVILISFPMEILHSTVKSNASRHAASYRSAVATCWLDSILGVFNFATGIHYLQLKHDTKSSDTTTPTWGSLIAFLRVGCFKAFLRQMWQVERACIYFAAFWDGFPVYC